MLTIFFVVFSLFFYSTYSSESATGHGANLAPAEVDPNATEVGFLSSIDKCGNTTKHTGCENGLIIPAWTPHVNEVSAADVAARAIIYFLSLAYLFVGVSIIADRFVSAIEVITSQEREVKVKKANGQTVTVMVRVWNETVSNLTLAALGTSAPEICLSLIETIFHNFDAGDLGPGRSSALRRSTCST